MKKSFLSLALTLALCLSLAVPAFAVTEESITDQEAGITISISDVYYCETISVATGNAHLSGEWSVKEIPVYHLKDSAAITVTNHGDILGPLGQGDTSYTHYHETWITAWELVQDGDTWETAYLDETPVDYRQPLTSGVPAVIAKVSDYGIPSAANGEINECALQVDRDGVIGAGPTMYDITIYYTVGEEPLLDGTGQSPNPDNTAFDDVKPGDWFYEPVQWAVKEGVTNGTSLTTFSPNQDCTVAHILTFLWRANGSPKAEGDNPFSDVKADDWFYGAALWAQEQGMVTGDTFGPDTPCTRSMAVKYLWQAAGSPSAKASNFSDVPAGADYAQAVNWAVEKGITNGTSLTSFSPSEVCTRGHIVTFLYRDLAK